VISIFLLLSTFVFPLLFPRFLEAIALSIFILYILAVGDFLLSVVVAGYLLGTKRGGVLSSLALESAPESLCSCFAVVVF